MAASELVNTQHLTRKAIIYVRQSTPHQVLTNQESLNLQYALKQRAVSLGWRDDDVEIIDSDLGLTGVAVEHREGFKELVAKVSLGQVGIILSTEVNRLSRNCTDWYPLLDVCGFKGALIADREGVYDPATANGRLLLGLKGTLSEMELFTIRARMQAGLLNKAQRGDLAVQLPTGLDRDQLGRVAKTPNVEVQQRIDLVFRTFLHKRAARKVLRYLNEHQLLLPRRDNRGDLAWKPPTISAILAILKNPAYAGAFVYGRTISVPRGASPHNPAIKHVASPDWKICIKDRYPAYVSWETFERIQVMLADNHAEYYCNQTRGVPRAGKALLQGLVYCGQCGHKMLVQYKPNVVYLCNALHQHYGGAVCQTIYLTRVDPAVVAAFFQALPPVEIDVYSRAMAAHKQSVQQADRGRQQQIERLRYQAGLAQRQFNRVDPDNRLVAGELEARWETALRDLRQAEVAAAQASQVVVVPFTVTAELKSCFTAIGQKLPLIWDKDILSVEQKKALLRCLIEKVVLHRLARDQVQARIVWVGGETTTLLIPVPVNSFAALSSAAEMEKLIVAMATEGASDQQIAAQLTAQGYRSPMRQSVLPSTVRTIRLRRRILQRPCQSHQRDIPGFLTVPQLAKTLGVTASYIYHRIRNGLIVIAKDSATGLFLFPDKEASIDQLRRLTNGKLQKSGNSKGHQVV